jgi:hypothetical protein
MGIEKQFQRDTSHLLTQSKSVPLIIPMKEKILLTIIFISVPSIMFGCSYLDLSAISVFFSLLVWFIVPPAILLVMILVALYAPESGKSSCACQSSRRRKSSESSGLNKMHRQSSSIYSKYYYTYDSRTGSRSTNYYR